MIRISPLIAVLSLIFSAAVQAAWAVPVGGYIHPELLIDPEELKLLIDKKEPGYRIIDVRENLQYLTGHIPGAIQVWRPDIEDKAHPLPGMMAPRNQIEELMGSLGINNQDRIIMYSYSDGPDHARLWWILAYYGFPVEQLKLLDGGIDAWKSRGYPVEITPPKTGKERFKLQEKSGEAKAILCTLPDVKSALKNPRKVVIDVRSKKEYVGEETKKGATRPGRIPGVTWIEWKDVLIEEGPQKGYWKPAEDIKKIFASKGVTPDKDIYIY